ncbi:armadillo-type protein [Mycena sanguinolenta]|nr:armadillo-type protein [Mycena sanguinolenta]
MMEISVATNALSHLDWRIRVAGLRVLEKLADGKKYKNINFPAKDMLVRCFSDEVEAVKLAGLRTFFKFIDQEIFGDRVAIPDTLPEAIFSLLSSESEDIRISAINIIPTYLTEVEATDDIIRTLMNVWDRRDEASRIATLQTLCSLVDTGNFCINDVFVQAIRGILPSLLSDGPAAVRMAALQMLPGIAKHDVFTEIVNESLSTLLRPTVDKDLAGSAQEVDLFSIMTLKTISDVAKNETFRRTIEATKLSEKYASAAKEGGWLLRVAFLKLMSVLDLSAKDFLKTTLKQMIPDISDALRDSENNEVRMAGVQLLSIPIVKEIPPHELNSLLRILVTLLSDSEEEVRITALQTLSGLAVQEVFREAINGSLPALLEALRHDETRTRVAALRTCATLAQDVTFRDIVNLAAPQIVTCVTDADDDVQVAAMITLSQLSRDEEFRLVVSEAAPLVMSQLNSGYWTVRRQAARTLSIFAENDAFADIINSFIPKIVEFIKDPDEDVRVEVSKTLLSYVERNVYRPSIRGALQTFGPSHLVDLVSDQFKHVRMAALPLIPKVVELGALPDSAKMVMSSIVKLLWNDDEGVCVAALEAIRALVERDREYAKEFAPEIPKLIELLKTDDWRGKISTALLLTLSAMVTRDKESASDVVKIVSRVFVVLKDTEEPQFWDATARVFLALASLGEDLKDNVHKIVSACVTSALEETHRHARVWGLLTMESIAEQIPGFKFDDCRPTVLELLDSEDLDVRLATIRVVSSWSPLSSNLFEWNVLDPGGEERLHTVTQTAWLEILTDLKSTNPTGGAFEKLCTLADYVDVFAHADTMPAIIAALQGPRALPCLRAVSKLAAQYRFRDALVPIVPKVTAMLSNRNSDAEIRLEVLENLRQVAEYRKLRMEIQENVSVIISALKDRDPKVRVASLRVLLKLVEAVSPKNIPDRIQSTMPTLFTLLRNSATREESIALINCLARDKTFRSDLLTRLLPMILDCQTAISWGQILLIARLLEDERLKLEESDLQFTLCLITCKKAELQDYVMKFMTTTLQKYLETCRNASKFPPSLSSAFSSVALLKR